MGSRIVLSGKVSRAEDLGLLVEAILDDGIPTHGVFEFSSGGEVLRRLQGVES